DSAPSDNYAITGCSGLSPSNYTITYELGSLRKRAGLTVSIAAAQHYGANATYTPTLTGLIDGDAASVVTGSVSCSSLTTALTVGTDGLTGCSGLQAPAKYAVEYTGQLVVTPATLSATVTGSWTWAAPAPGYTATFSGFRNSEGPSVVSGTLACTTDATTTS